MKMDELLKIILLTQKNVPKATNQPKLGCKPSQAKKKWNSLENLNCGSVDTLAQTDTKMTKP